MFKWLSTRNAQRIPIGLRVELDEITAALDALRVSNRKEFGKIWRRLRDEPESEGMTGDPKLDAILRAQNGHVPPSTRNPSDDEIVERLPTRKQ